MRIRHVEQPPSAVESTGNCQLRTVNCVPTDYRLRPPSDGFQPQMNADERRFRTTCKRRATGAGGRLQAPEDTGKNNQEPRAAPVGQEKTSVLDFFS